MVKKISGPDGPNKASEISRISETSSIKGVDAISSVSGISAVSGIGGITPASNLGTKLSPSNQSEVLKTIDTEAEKLFAGKRIPRKRQKTITDALKMAVIAATLKEDDS
ncbi:MAG TPA: hypothetical protein PKA63_07150 [Oligoflexia bacterium]|nr:hypothetical protein [Oligoflexia bacterium]HMP48427.1 hypothetical protein [Oligoflexia bacterium]